MNFELNDEQQMIYEYGKNISQKHDRKQWVEHADRKEFTVDMWKQVGQDGFLGMMVDEKYGGAGQGMQEMALLMEGMANEGIPLLMLVVGPTMTLSHISAHGTEEQKQFYLPDACKGEKIFCFAITEPNAGSNTMKITTVAKEKAGKFILNGTKTFISGADVADYALVVARTTPHDQVERKTDGFTLFIVDMKAKGVEKHIIPVSVSMPDTQWTLFFDDVELGPENVIGEVGKGFELLFDSLNPERIIVATMCTGLGRYALDKAVAYASERVVFDGPIGAYQGVQHPLAMAKTEIELASLMARKAAWCFDNKHADEGAAANMAKYAAAEAAIHAVDASVQAHGGNGFTKEYGIFDLYPVVRLMRTAPLNREIILSYIGQHVMGLPRSY